MRDARSAAALGVCMLVACATACGGDPAPAAQQGGSGGSTAPDAGPMHMTTPPTGASGAGSGGSTAPPTAMDAGTKHDAGPAPAPHASVDAGQPLEGCARLCRDAKTTCAGEDEARCLLECEAFERVEPCSALFEAMLDCQLANRGSCDEDGAYEVTGCAPRAGAYLECYLEHPPDDDGDGIVTPEDSCPFGETVTAELLPGCACREGYRANAAGDACADVNECSEAIDECEQSCTNGVGGYTCGCPDGFRLNADGRRCDEIDACEPGEQGHERCMVAQGGRCTDEAVGHSCNACPAGFKLDVPGKACIDVDECETDNGGCAQQCNNLPGTSMCSCRGGFTLAADGRGCDDVPDCSSGGVGIARCGVGSGGSCTDVGGSYRCSACPAGLQLAPDGRECADPCASGRWGYQRCLVAHGGSCSTQSGGYGCGGCPAGTSVAGDRCALPLGRIDAGGSHGCAVLDDGRVKCVGENLSGQLGIGERSPLGGGHRDLSGDPAVSLGTGRKAVFVATGSQFSCAVLDNGRVKCWGGNDAGQLGIGSFEDTGDEPNEMGDSLPYVELGTGRTARALALGVDHACALLDDGSAKCWGSNGWGCLGIADTTRRGDEASDMGNALPAAKVGTNRTVLQISTGLRQTCAVLDDGALKCWGENTDGKLGLGDTASRGSFPETMGDALPAVALGTGRHAIGVATGYYHACALLDDGNVKCWGQNWYGQLGYGDEQIRGTSPAHMGDALPNVDLGYGKVALAIVAGYYHTCALLDDGVKCWGHNDFGLLGAGDLEDRGDAPDEMGDDLGVVSLGKSRFPAQLSAGVYHNCAYLLDGGFKCWGFGETGRLGTGNYDDLGDEPGEMGDNLLDILF